MLKLLPLVVLICSVCYAQAQTGKGKKPSKKSKSVTVKPADTLTKAVPIDSLTLNTEDSVEFDPMDTLFHVPVSPNAMESAVKYSSRDSMPYDAISRTFYLYGDANVAFEKMTLKSDFIKVELNKTLITSLGTKDSSGQLIGRPYFKDGDDEYRADVIKYNYKTKKGYLSEFMTKEGEGYVHGEQVKKDEENNFGVRNAKYTTCELDHPHYYIGAYKIKVIPKKKIVTGPANLWIEGVPTILALPFGMFSIKRGQSSGVIIPQYGSSDNRGYFLRNGGYYFALGDHHDIQFTGDIYANTSWAARTLYRYSTRYRFSGNFGFNYNYNKFGLNQDDPGYYVSKDFQLNWLHRMDPKARPNTNFSANVSVVSHGYLANNSYVAQNIVTNQLSSGISYSKSFGNGKYNLATAARMAQNTATRDLSLSLPDVTFTVSSFAPFKPKYKATADKWYENITTNYTMQFRNEIITKDSILFRRWNTETNDLQPFLDTANRFGMVHSLPIQTSFKLLKFYTLSTSVTLTDYMYYKTIRKDTNGTLHNVNSFGFANAFTYTPRVGLSTRYYGMVQFKQGGLKAIRHVVTPTLSFSYSPDYGDPKYGYYKTYRNSAGQEIKYSIFENGIVGGPGMGRQGNIGFGVDNNLELKIKPGKNDSTQTDRKIQIFESISLSGAYNIFADSLNLSRIAINGRTRLFKNIALSGGASVDPYRNVIVNNGTYKSYTQRKTTYWEYNRSLGLLTSANMGLSANFSPEMFKSKKTKHSAYEGELKYINDFPSSYYDFNIPWSLNLNYTVTYSKYATLNDPLASNYIQTLNFSGDLNVTKNWKIGYTSGYDLHSEKITFTSIDFIRNLHCWEFKLNWIPIGYRQSFLFTINVKSSLLQDLKMTRRKEWFDRPL